MVCTESGPKCMTQQQVNSEEQVFNVQKCKQVQGGGVVCCPGIQNEACEVTSEIEGEGIVTWCLLQGNGKAAAQRREVRLSNRPTGRQESRKHETTRRVRQSEARWKRHRGISYTS